MKTRTSLTLCVVAVLALAWATSAQAALVAYWDCDEGSGTTLTDYTANDNDGTCVNGPYGAPTIDGTGHTGLSGDYSLVAKGGTDYVKVPDSATLVGGGSSFTMTVWLKETYGGNSYPYIFLTSNGGDRRWFIQGEDSWGGDQAYVWSDPDGDWKEGLGFTITDNSYDMYAFLYSGSQMKSYRNGSLLSTVNVGATWPTFTDSFRIGGRGDDWTSFEGLLDDISVWDENIGEARAKAMYNITTVDSGALVDYTVEKMKALFDVYDTGTPASVTSNVGTYTWMKFTDTAGTAGSASKIGGDYYTWFDGTSGVMTPEPATMALLGLGGLGLLHRRKRR